MSPERPGTDSVARAERMPLLGLGTYRNDDYDQCVASVRTALEMGYRHVTLPAFDRLRGAGSVRHVGVSNFEPAGLERASAVLDAPVFANQVEVHPLLPQTELREYAAEYGIRLVAYAPIARGRVFEVPVLSEIAEERGVSEAQVSLAWLREKGIAAIPKATGVDHIRDNWESRTLALDDGESARIDAIERRERLVDPGFGPWN